jgi:uncharacterized pyridoxal phosphate-containing UPF0001 family protein
MSKFSIKDNLAFVRQQLSFAAAEAGRSPGEIKLIAVSKKNLIWLILMVTVISLISPGERPASAAAKLNCCRTKAKLSLIENLLIKNFSNE